MMHPSKVNVFTNKNFGDIRTIMIEQEPWFVGVDIANALGYAKARNAIHTHVDEEDLRKETVQTNGGPQEMTVINESGMYSMILGSRIPAAKQFKRWVTSEVLPKIRQNGIYSSLPDFSNPVIAARAWADELENRQKAEAEAKRLAESNAKKTALLKEQEPKVEYYDTIAKGNHENLVSIRDACKLIGAREKDTISLLLARRYLYHKKTKSGKKGPLMPYAKHAENGDGMFAVKEYCYDEYVNKYGHVKKLVTPSLRVTVEGRAKLAKLCRKNGLLKETV